MMQFNLFTKDFYILVAMLWENQFLLIPSQIAFQSK